ncbi:UNVERIFIED_CONTAM: hypothetical protein FKN15_040703 [Acipenser sinensis]
MLEALISSYIRKWLGGPRCLSRVELYGKGILQLPVSALTEEFKCAKVRLEMTLVESRDKCVREAAPVLKTGRKWAAKKAVEDAKAALRIGDIMGQVQHGRGGLGLSSAPPTWHKAAPAQRRKLVVNEVQKQEERMRCIKAISQAKQGEWMRWESVEQRKIGWQDLWSMEQSRISFLISPSLYLTADIFMREVLGSWPPSACVWIASLCVIRLPVGTEVCYIGVQKWDTEMEMEAVEAGNCTSEDPLPHRPPVHLRLTNACVGPVGNPGTFSVDDLLLQLHPSSSRAKAYTLPPCRHPSATRTRACTELRYPHKLLALAPAYNIPPGRDSSARTPNSRCLAPRHCCKIQTLSCNKPPYCHNRLTQANACHLSLHPN